MMSVKIFDTLSREKKEFVPLEEGKVKMYVCGPTVYDYIHIGNARPVIFFDVVRRYLELIGFDVEYIQNFTDVDDKLIRKAADTGEEVSVLAEKYIQAFYEDLDALKVKRAVAYPRVTEHIEEIISFIQQLIDTDFAYEKEGDVYFRTAKFPEYGKLSHQNMEQLQFGIRIEVDERKERPQDFVMWKAAKPGEIFWESPWGKGRPGWHIECSAMARKYLGDTLDIHGGGQDLTFPHHECEAAQSEAATGKALARYWMHNGYIHINNEKMSKSEGNGINVVQLRTKYKPETIRYFMLSAHYRNPLNFSDEAMEQAAHSIARLDHCWNNLQYALQQVQEEHAELDLQLKSRLDECTALFHQKMQDDFNTPDAITAMFLVVSEANQYMQQQTMSRVGLQQIEQTLQMMNEVLGMIAVDEPELLDEEIDRLLEERMNARKMKNWARADEIRDLLQEKGIVLEDTPQGTRWRRK